MKCLLSLIFALNVSLGRGWRETQKPNSDSAYRARFRKERCVGSFLLRQPMSRQGRPERRQEAAQPRTTKAVARPSRREQRLPCRPCGIDRSVGERKRNQVNHVSARSMAIGGRNGRIRAKTFQEIPQQDFSAYSPRALNQSVHQESASY